MNQEGRSNAVPTQRDADQANLVELTPREDKALLERETQRQIGIGADEFAVRWRRGDYRDADDPKITSIAMLLPDAG